MRRRRSSIRGGPPASIAAGRQIGGWPARSSSRRAWNLFGWTSRSGPLTFSALLASFRSGRWLHLSTGRPARRASWTGGAERRRASLSTFPPRERVWRLDERLREDAFKVIGPVAPVCWSERITRVVTWTNFREKLSSDNFQAFKLRVETARFARALLARDEVDELAVI